MLELIKSALRQLLNDMDSGNSSISEKEQKELIDLFDKINKQELNKTEAAEYLGVSTSTINNYVNRKLIPEGIKKQGYREKVWLKSDLNKFLLK